MAGLGALEWIVTIRCRKEAHERRQLRSGWREDGEDPETHWKTRPRSQSARIPEVVTFEEPTAPRKIS